MLPHTLPSAHALQVTLPLHTPPVQLAPANRCASPGQVALAPSQLSVRSHSLTAARHETPLPFTRLMHAPDPSQVSCASHAVLLDEPQLVPCPAWRSAGQVIVEPVHISSTSHALTAARQITLEGFGPWPTHTGTPLLQLMTPSSHTLPVEHAPPGLHPPQPPSPLQYCPEPQLAPDPT